MRAFITYVFMTVVPCVLLSQLTFVVKSYQGDLKDNEHIYIAGNFQGWNPGDDKYAMTGSDTFYTLTFNPDPGRLEFKFTRGDWARVEGTADGKSIPNRKYNYPGGLDTLVLEISGWEDREGMVSTAASNVMVWTDSFYFPKLDRYRRIWVYLPPDYETSEEHYPVLYMHDGQNIFDAATSYAGEWEVDETLNALFEAGDDGCIVVAIDNGGDERVDDYAPWVHKKYGGGRGDAYIHDLVYTLKPDMDRTFRTKPESEYSGIMGSSMGGLISLFAGLAHQDVFGKVGVFSPSYWFSDELYVFAGDRKMTCPQRIYTVAGRREDAGIERLIKKMEKTLLRNGYRNTDMETILCDDGTHSEWFWAREFTGAYLWLFEDGFGQ